MFQRLSLPLEHIRDHYDAVVIGSGYGGGVAASRLARAGRKVCVLERGEERQPGEFPETLVAAAEQMQAETVEGTIGSPTGLYDFHINPDINVLTGCGLGGTSLINANVSLRPDARVFESPIWPKALRDDVQGGLADGVRRAEEMLKPRTYPEDWPELKKLTAQFTAAAALNQRIERTAINVTFEDGINHVGVEQKKCSLCGDCVSGCNHGSKNTTLMNYLPDARNRGAEIFTGARVKYVERSGKNWLVHYEPVDARRGRFNAPLMSVSADIVVVAAGTLGSTEILLRSKARGLPLSDQVGQRFSGNGDVLAFTCDTKDLMNGVGAGTKDPATLAPVGPCITSVIDLRDTPDVRDGIIVEEGSIPGALGPVLAESFAALSAPGIAHGRLSQIFHRVKDEVDSLIHGSHTGAMAHTQTFLVMGHDDSKGEMSLENDRLHISWPGVGEQPAIESANKELAAVAGELGGVFVKNPIWSDLFKHSLVTVHPLGGCPMGERAETGVVDHKGQVFAGTSGTNVHDGLYVCDAAVIPQALGVNPLLTISGLAERSMTLLARDRGWTIDYTLPSTPPASAPQKMGLQFTEKMAGYISTAVTGDYETAAARGKADGSPCEFVLTIVSEDLDELLNDPSHPAEIYGTVVAPALSPDPITVSEGQFNLFVDNPDQVGVRNMRYRMKLDTSDGRVLFFDGYKKVEPGSLLRIWPATTTLYVTVFNGDSDAAPVLGRGILHIRIADFARQMTTMEIRNASSVGERLKGLAEFGELFAGVLWHTYGGVASALFGHEEAPPLRKKRPLRAPVPETHFFKTADNAELRLVRFNGGSKGPIVCAPGFSNSTMAFMFDGIEPNFAEYFAAHGYDTWLFDYRASPALPVSRTQFTLDDVAKYDWPAAVSTVREATGAADVQIVGHCVGSLTTYMALLTGLTGVRQFVSSQLTPHIDVEMMDKIKAGIHLDEAMKLIGMTGVDTGRETTPALEHIDRLLALYPMPADWRALGGVARRIFAIYGHVLKPANLNPATADALGDMFGFGNLTAFAQITELLRKGHLVDSRGQDTYLPNVDRLKLPIAIIHGADNIFFFPRGSELTFEWLRANNGPELYTRHVIPNYAHLDCFIGANAARDVLPTILAELETRN